jgi:predicted dehydrogenase
MTVDLAQLRPGAQTTDYFHAVLSYPQRRIVLHGTMVAAAESARYIIHGTRGSYVKFGLDPQEDRLKTVNVCRRKTGAMICATAWSRGWKVRNW